MMNNLLEIGIFILIEIILNRIVNLAFRIMSKKHNTVHLRFLKSAANFLVALVVTYCLCGPAGSGQCHKRVFPVRVQALQCG